MAFNKKGTEKPIEIFVALFVILAVALVMLKMFGSQTGDFEKKMAEYASEEKQKQLSDDAILHCNRICTEASKDGCSLRKLAQFCISYGSDAFGSDSLAFLDLNKNKIMDCDTTTLVGIGISEDNVPCHALQSTCCSKQLSGSSCKEILKQYWESTGQGSTATDWQNLVHATVPIGSLCTGKTTWFDAADFATSPW